MLTAGIVDWGTSNLEAVKNLLRKSGYDPAIATPNSTFDYDLIVMPGVGEYQNAMTYLEANGYHHPLVSAIKNNIPTLGICLGFQILGNFSQESPGIRGLGVLDSECARIRTGGILGWRPLNCYLEDFFFHNHIYGFYEVEDDFYTVKDNDGFVSLAIKDFLVGLQFHPEKSQTAGVKLLNKIKSEVWKH